MMKVTEKLSDRHPVDPEPGPEELAQYNDLAHLPGFLLTPPGDTWAAVEENRKLTGRIVTRLLAGDSLGDVAEQTGLTPMGVVKHYFESAFKMRLDHAHASLAAGPSAQTLLLSHRQLYSFYCKTAYDRLVRRAIQIERRESATSLFTGCESRKGVPIWRLPSSRDSLSKM